MKAFLVIGFLFAGVTANAQEASVDYECNVESASQRTHPESVKIKADQFKVSGKPSNAKNYQIRDLEIIDGIRYISLESEGVGEMYYKCASSIGHARVEQSDAEAAPIEYRTIVPKPRGASPN